MGCVQKRKKKERENAMDRHCTYDMSMDMDVNMVNKKYKRYNITGGKERRNNRACKHKSIVK